MKEVFRVTLSDGHFIEVTGDHLIQAYSKRRLKSNNWISLNSAKVGDYMQYHHKNTAIINDIKSSQREISEMALVGWLQVDGISYYLLLVI